MRSTDTLIVVCLVSVLLPGCASREPAPVQFSVRRTAAPRDALLDSAEVVLIEMGYKIAKRDDAAGVIVTQPVQSRAGGVKAGDGVISSTSPARRVIEVRVESGPDGSRVSCKAALQEQVSQAAAQVLQSARAGDEGIGQTAIERDAATTAEQNTYWRTVSRDRSLERAVLDAVEKRNAAAAPG
jgi:hypothetical protein